MPQISRSTPGDAVSPIGLGSPRIGVGVTADAFGAGGAKQAQKIGTDLRRIGAVSMAAAEKMQEEQDKTLVRDAITRYRVDLVRHASEAKRRKGSEAIGVYRDTEKYAVDLHDELLSRFKTDKQRELFSASAFPVKVRYLEDAMLYEASQEEEFRQKSYSAENTALVQEAIGMQNPVILGRNEAEIRANTRAQYVGLPEDEVANKEAEAVDLLYRGYLSNLEAQENAEEAKEFYEQNKERFLPSNRAKIESALEKAAKTRAIKRIVDESFSSGGSASSALDQIEKEFPDDPEVASAAIGYLQQRIGLKRTMDVERRAEIIGKAMADGTLPPMDLSSAEDAELRSIYQEVNRLRTSGTTQHNSALVAKVESLSAEDFMNLDLASLSPHVHVEKWQEWYSRRKQLASGGASETGGSDPVKMSSAYTLADKILKSEGVELNPQAPGMSKGDKKKTDQRRARFYRVFEKRLEAMPPEQRTEENIAKMIREDLLTPTTSSLEFFNIPVPFTEHIRYGFEDEWEALQEPDAPEPSEEVQRVIDMPKNLLAYPPDQVRHHESFTVAGDFYGDVWVVEQQDAGLLRVFDAKTGKERKMYRWKE